MKKHLLKSKATEKSSSNLNLTKMANQDYKNVVIQNRFFYPQQSAAADIAKSEKRNKML